MASLGEYLNRSRRALSDGAYEDALSWCHRVLQYFPKCLEAYSILGQASFEIGQVKEAEETFKKVASADPENALAHRKLGLLFQQRGEIEEALWELLISRELEPDHPDIKGMIEKLPSDSNWVARPSPGLLGRLYMRQGLYSRAAAEFRALADSLDLRVALSESLWRIEEYEEAEEVCHRILQDSPDCVKALLLLGEISRKSPLAGDEGKRLWEQAKALDPLNAIARQLFAATPVVALFPETDMEIEEMAEAVSPTEEATPLGEELAVVLPLEGLEAPPPEIEEREEIAAEEEVTLVASLPMEEETGPSEEAGELPSWLAEGVEEKAVERGAEAEEMPPLPELEFPAFPQPETATEPEVTKEEEGPPAEATEVPEKMVPEWLAEAPGPAEEMKMAEARVEEVTEAPQWLAQTQEQPEGLELLDGEIRQIEERLQAEPTNIEAHLTLADLYVRAGRLEEALASYQNLMRIDPEALDRVRAGLENLVGRSPANLQAHRILGDVYVKVGRFKEAIQEYAAALPPQGTQSGNP